MDASDVTEVLVVGVRHETYHFLFQSLLVWFRSWISSGIQRHWWVLHLSVDEGLNIIVYDVVGFGRVGIRRVWWGTVLLLLLAAQAEGLIVVLKIGQHALVLLFGEL